jgi:tRNA1Val (adenine37-N6)-methyltransferase
VTELSDDALFGGRVTLRQPRRGAGYRTNVDALLLAAFAAQGRRAKLAVDLGAGSGAVGLSLLFFDRAEKVILVDIDRAATEAARANLVENGWTERGAVVHADVARLPRGAAELVVCNPPYVAPGRGRLPKHPATARARSGELASFTRAARALLGKRARACFVYPARELGALWVALHASGLVPKRLRAVHADAASPARIVLVEACAAKPGGLAVEPPLVERDAGGYTAEMRAIVAGEPVSATRAVDRARSHTPHAR